MNPKYFLKVYFIFLLIINMINSVYAYTSSVDSDEVVVFFTTLGYFSSEANLWHLPVHGWIYEPELTGDIRRHWNEWFSDTPLDKAEISPNERLGQFFVDNQGGKQVVIRLGEKLFPLPTSAENGHFQTVLHLSPEEVEAGRQGEFLPFVAVLSAQDQRQFRGQIQLLNPSGLSVISDIDDTIKISEVTDKTALFANTFQHSFRAVPQMNELYSHWQTKQGAQFHYVSGSPWQLYLPLWELLKEAQFPLGSFHLRPFRWRDGSFLTFLKSPETHKTKIIEHLIASHLTRRFILVGDSGERDPEIYAQIARRFPDQVLAIVVRDVTQEPADSPRYQEIFRGLPAELWMIFIDPKQVQAILSEQSMGPGG